MEDEERSEVCGHLGSVRDVEPTTLEGCEDCLRTGGQWVNLRMCLSCGHVGCCNSSPNRHAERHYRLSQHPIVRSFQPGELWGWCYADDLMLSPQELQRALLESPTIAGP